MPEPVFLTLDQVLRLHASLIDTYGGSPGVRDVGLLQSDLAQPMPGLAASYLHADLFEMAAAYDFHIVQFLWGLFAQRDATYTTGCIPCVSRLMP